MNEQTMNYFDSENLTKIIYKWRKVMLILAIATLIISYFGTYLIKPKYEANVVLLPCSTNSISKALISLNPAGKEDIMEFGSDEKVEQMLQILSSSEVRDRIIQKFNLMEHYDIDPNSSYPYTKLFNKYKKLITFRKNEYMAVEIEVLDCDPQTAADIANEITNSFDTVINKTQKERAKIGFNIVENEYNNFDKHIKDLEDSLNILRGMGVLEYEKQAEVITDQMSAATAKNNNAGAKILEEKLQVLAKYGGKYVSIRDEIIYDKEKLSDLKLKYQEARMDAERNIPQKFVIEKATKPEKASYPIRWLITILTTLCTLLVSLTIIVIFEKQKS
ncbi:MAG: Wzz/FepE/Etk N-terminal domain-containing protein [Bacteroidales bacterium]|nr:Wzz/FepE/Etk N-terminal domain-containing protein [Bacteroidales bacterium]